MRLSGFAPATARLLRQRLAVGKRPLPQVNHHLTLLAAWSLARVASSTRKSPMPIELKMPALSPTMEEGTLAKWLVKEGDTVASGDILAEIETDKATMEFEAVDEGKIARILVPEGSDGVKVGTPIAILAGEGEEVSAAAPAPK